MTTRYRVTYNPVFTDGMGRSATQVEVLFGWEGEFVRVKSPGHGERTAVSVEQGVRFLEAMDALPPEVLPDIIDALPGEQDCMDDWIMHGRIEREDGTQHTFSAMGAYLWSERAKPQRAFFSQILQLAQEVVRRPEVVLKVNALYAGILIGDRPPPSR